MTQRTPPGRRPVGGRGEPRQDGVAVGALWGIGPGWGGHCSVTQGWVEGISHTFPFSTTSVYGNGVECRDFGSGSLVALVTRSQLW